MDPHSADQVEPGIRSREDREDKSDLQVALDHHKHLRNEYSKFCDTLDINNIASTQINMEKDISFKEDATSDQGHSEENGDEHSNNDGGQVSQDRCIEELQSQNNEINPLIRNNKEFGQCSSREGSADNDNATVSHSSEKQNEEVWGLRRRRQDVGGRRDSEDEWSPGGDADLQRIEDVERDDEKEREEEEGVSLTEEEDNFSDYLDSETDYENDHIIQYQAAIVAGLIDDERQCWVCFASDEDDPSAVWVHPCRCSGTTKWVHHVCLQRWVDEKQKGNNTANVSCPQCGTEYIIKFPPSGPIMKILDGLDLLVGRVCPLIAGGVLVGGTFWLFVTYGAVTVMTVAGHDEGWNLMEGTDPLLLLVSLPLIPIGLFLGKMVRWQEPVLKVLRMYLPHAPLTRFLLPAFSEEPELERSGAAASLPPSSDPVSVTRTFCGALIFPTIATFLGGALYPDTPSPVRRALLGGLTFIIVKGVLKVYHKQHQYIRQSRRVIGNFDPNNAVVRSPVSEV